MLKVAQICSKLFEHGSEIYKIYTTSIYTIYPKSATVTQGQTQDLTNDDILCQGSHYIALLYFVKQLKINNNGVYK